MKADFQLTMAGETIQIDTLNAALGDFWFDLSGTVKTKPAPVVDLKFLTSPVKLETLKNFVPGLKEKNLKGSLRLEGTVQGPADEPDKLKFKIKTALIEIGRVEDIIEGFPEIAAGLPETLKIGGALSADVTLSGVAKQIQAIGKARLDALKIIYGEYFHKPAGLPMGADFDITYGEETLTIKKLKLSLGKMGANVSGEIKDFKQPKLDIRISSAGLPLSQIARVVPPAEAYRPGGEITLNLRLSGAAQKLEELSASGEASFKGVNIVFPAARKTLRDLKGKVTLSGRSIKLRDASLTFGRTPLKVEADVKDFSSPRVIFALQSPLFMVEDFLPPERAKNGKSRGSKAPGKKGEVETPARALAGVNAEGRVRIKRLVYKKLELTDLEADLTIDKGVIEVDPMAFNLFQGRCKGYANLDFSGAQPQFRVIADLNGLNVNSILQSQAGIGNVMKGTLSTTLDIRGAGDTYDTLSKTLNGKGKIKIENGSFTGFSMLRGLSSLTGAAGLGGFSKKQTPFDLIDTDFNLADGKVRTDSVKLNFDEYGLSATGYVGLDKSLAYDVLVTVGESMSKRVGRSGIGSLLLNRSGRMVVPLSVSGYLPKPKVSIKKEFLQKQFLEYGAGRLMKQFKGGSKTEAPDILKGILGGLGGKSSQQPRAAPQQEERSREEKKPALDPGQILRDIFKSR